MGSIRNAIKTLQKHFLRWYLTAALTELPTHDEEEEEEEDSSPPCRRHSLGRCLSLVLSTRSVPVSLDSRVDWLHAIVDSVYTLQIQSEDKRIAVWRIQQYQTNTYGFTWFNFLFNTVGRFIKTHQRLHVNKKKSSTEVIHHRSHFSALQWMTYCEKRNMGAYGTWNRNRSKWEPKPVEELEISRCLRQHTINLHKFYGWLH